MTTAESTDKILTVLAEVAETDEVRTNPDLALYDLQVLDSMKTVQLIVALGQEMGVEVSPAEFEREAWATPRQLVEDVLRRLSACRASAPGWRLIPTSAPRSLRSTISRSSPASSPSTDAATSRHRRSFTRSFKACI